MYVKKMTICMTLRISVYVRLGDWDTGYDIDCERGICADPPIDVRIESVFSNFDPDWPWLNDIGLIRLRDRVKYTLWISPICLPPFNESSSPIEKSYVNETFLAVGWNVKSRKFIAQKRTNLQQAT